MNLINFIKTQFPGQGFVPLHVPVFMGNEKEYLNNCIDSTFVSSVGEYVNEFERRIAEYTGIKYAVAATNGTAALHLALHACGVERGDLVLTQSLTFVATCNAISYCGAEPAFIDISEKTLGMCPESLQSFLEDFCELRNDGQAYYKETGKRIRACVPMHSFGLPCEIDRIADICDAWGIELVEDAAESLGSFYQGQHTGSFGKCAAISFNGNKIITAGGGGVVLTNDEELAKRLKHQSTTAKVPHAYEFEHDEIAFNYRMPNLNAALLCAQLEQLPKYLESKRNLAQAYQVFFTGQEKYAFLSELDEAQSNYWLNTILCDSAEVRNELLAEAQKEGVQIRPAWRPMHQLEIYSHCLQSSLSNTEVLASRIVNLPSSYRV